jgi:hypothetical protein
MYLRLPPKRQAAAFLLQLVAEGERGGWLRRPTLPRPPALGDPQHGARWRAQNIAMRISGHKTDSVLRRYDIVDEEDLADAFTLTQDYVDRHRHETPKVTPIRPAARQE